MKIDPEALGRRFGEIRMSWLLGGWLLLVAAIALNRGVALLWGMVWLLAAAWLVAALFPRWQVRRMSVRRSVAGEGIVGSPVDILYETDAGWLPRYGLELLDRLGDEREHGLAAYLDRVRGKETLRLTWTPRVRGLRVLDEVIVQSRFPLGIAPCRRIIALPTQRIVVFPDAVPLRRLPLEQGVDSAAEQIAARARGGRDDYLGARPYRPGDDARSVNWRASARSNALIAREYDRPLERQLWIFLELSLREHYGARRDGTFETMFRIAHSVLLRAHGDGLATGLVYRDSAGLHSVAASRDRAALLRMRETLALAEGGELPALSGWIEREARLPRGGSWLLFAADAAQRRALTHACRARGATPLVVQFERDSYLREAVPTPAPGARWLEGAWVAPAQRGMDLSGLF